MCTPEVGIKQHIISLHVHSPKVSLQRALGGGEAKAGARRAYE